MYRSRSNGVPGFFVGDFAGLFNKQEEWQEASGFKYRNRII
jgi:hypothetical protein